MEKLYINFFFINRIDDKSEADKLWVIIIEHLDKLYIKKSMTKYINIISQHVNSVTAIEILKTLKQTPRLTPILIARMLDRPPSVMRNILVVLLELGLVESPVRGLYQITPLGEYVLEKLT